MPLVEPAPGHRRWWIGGGATLLAAAALITAFVLVGNTDESVSTPATDPSVTPTTAPTQTPVTPAPTTVPPVADEPGILTAGPEGVVERRGPEPRTLTTEPMVIALDTGDGRVIVQRRRGDGTGEGWTDADTVPLVLAADGSLTELFGTADWDGGVVLHDIEVVDGRRLLLYSLEVAMSDPQVADETLYVVDLETQERTEVAAGIGGWESGTGRLTLATTGLIVGEWSAEASHGIFIDDVPSPGVAASLPVPADLGLEESYTDCADCPHGFSVAPDGATVAWIDGDELVVDAINGESGEGTALSFTPGCCDTLDRVASTDSFLWSVDAPVEPQPPRLVAPDGSAVELEGAVGDGQPGRWRRVDTDTSAADDGPLILRCPGITG